MNVSIAGTTNRVNSMPIDNPAKITRPIALRAQSARVLVPCGQRVAQMTESHGAESRIAQLMMPTIE